MISLNTAPVSCIFGLPQGPVDTGNERTPHANARQSCLLPLSSFAGITEGRTDGLFHYSMFYVYELIDDAGKVFYVGKGTKRRIKSHRWPCMLLRDRPVAHYINALFKGGRDFTAKIVHEIEDADEAYRLEAERIAFHAQGSLVNVSTGGRGPFGVPKTERTRAALSRRFKGVPKTPEHRRKISEALKKHKRTPEHGAALSKALRGLKRKPKTPKNFEV
jgi:hypothetical protein